MKKVIGIIMPYIIVGFVFVMNYASIKYQNIIVSIIVGCLVGMWIMTVYNCIGTLEMRVFTAFNCFIFTAALFISLLVDLSIMQYLSTTIGLLVPLHYISYYILASNKPRLHMTYKYSYKNKKRRYF